MIITKTIGDRTYTMDIAFDPSRTMAPTPKDTTFGTLWVRSADGSGKYWCTANIVLCPNGKIKYGKETGWSLPVELMIYCDKVYKKLLRLKVFS